MNETPSKNTLAELHVARAALVARGKQLEASDKQLADFWLQNRFVLLTYRSLLQARANEINRINSQLVELKVENANLVNRLEVANLGQVNNPISLPTFFLPMNQTTTVSGLVGMYVGYEISAPLNNIPLKYRPTAYICKKTFGGVKKTAGCVKKIFSKSASKKKMVPAEFYPPMSVNQVKNVIGVNPQGPSVIDVPVVPHVDVQA